jgi:YggT family protein
MPLLDYPRVFAGLLLHVLRLAILIRIILSWFRINPDNPLVRALYQVTEPVLAPFRRVIPRLGMFDLAPLVAPLVLGFVGGQLHA